MIWRTVGKLRAVVRSETLALNPRLYALEIAGALLPRRDAGAARARLLRWAGCTVGDGTQVESIPRMSGLGHFLPKLSIGRDCTLARDCSFDLEEHITLGDRVTVGAEAMILTATHELGPREHRAGPVIRKPVVVEAGATLGARSILLPGVTVGAEATVEPGAVVTQDVLPNTRVGGIPAVKM